LKAHITLIAIGIAVGFSVGTVFGMGFDTIKKMNTSTAEQVDAHEFDVKLNELNQKVESFQGDKLNELNKKVDSLESSIQSSGASDASQAKITSLEKELKLMSSKLRSVYDDVDDLQQKIDKLKSAQVSTTENVLSVTLNKQEYNAGDLLTVTGTAASNKSVNIALLDTNGIVLSQWSTTTDSSGMFTFSIQISNSLSSGSYNLRLSQNDKIIEKPFRIVPTYAQPVQSSTQGLTLSVDRAQYTRGDNVILTGKTEPNVFIDIDIFDGNRAQVVRTSTKSDTGGNFLVQYNIPSVATLGDYEVKATVAGKNTTVKFSVVSSLSAQSSPPPTSGSLTIITDKNSYKRGDLAKITGKALPGSRITIFVEPPTGDKLVLSATATDTGNYIVLLSIDSSAATGNWKLSARASTIGEATTQIQVVS
jgi:uncharacterized protein YfaS (alpha-2-macroglobulin family)